MASPYVKALYEVINYLRGEHDLYDGNHETAIQVWNEAWDEMLFLGYNPETVDGIRSYIVNEL